MVFEDDYCLQNDARQPLTPNTCVNAEAFINTRRFSDGREETRESAEVANLSQCLEQPSDDREILNGNSDSKSGWFWRS